jgi:hypothetical protein
MRTAKAYFTGTHRYSFRPNEIAEILGVVTCYPENYPPRVCFHLLYSDGKEDYCPTEE